MSNVTENLKKKFPRVGPLLRSNFLAGIFVLLPLAVSGYLLLIVVDKLWRIKDLIPEHWLPEVLQHSALGFLFNVLFTAVSTLILALLISAMGWFSKQYLGQKVIRFVSEVLQHIPILRSVHGALEQLLSTISKGEGSQFSRVVLVEFPKAGMYSLAFVTGASKVDRDLVGYINVFIPMTPNPTSGFYLIVPESAVKETHLTVEEAFRTLLSLGIAQPQNGKLNG